MTTSDVIALGALAVSIYTIRSFELKSRKNDREQKVIKDEKDRLRKLLLEIFCSSSLLQVIIFYVIYRLRTGILEYIHYQSDALSLTHHQYGGQGSDKNSHHYG